MIFEWFIAFILATFSGVLDLVLPDFDTIVPDLAGVLSGVATLNAFFPITESMGVAVMLLTVQGVMFFVKITQTIVAHIPFVGGGGS